MEPLSNQVYAFLITIAIGLGIGFLYTMYCEIRRYLRVKSTKGHVFDLIFWLITTLFTYFFLLLGNWGEVRFYIILGLIIGAVFYIKVLAKLITPIVLKIIEIIVRSIGFIFKVILYPFRLIGKIILVPLGFLGMLFTKINNVFQRLLWRVFGKPFYAVTRRLKKKFYSYKRLLILRLINTLKKK